MPENVDLKLDDNGDIGFAENGDFKLTQGIETSLLVSLFANARASSDEVANPLLRNGWWGELFYPTQFGSKIWLTNQSPNNRVTALQIQNYAHLSLQWLIDQNYADRIEVSTVNQLNTIILTVTIYKNGDIITERSYDVWRATVAEIRENS